ncbi:hypothetical protein M2137_001906 [Parabacteroides sp. PFB2-10]|uniref:hypothetical protein n=1 Tax=Parabacteroides sp. PFB2-10 TaxID=1742405 RepID=UPI002472F111|nr:hypothetical protein [Parabacteroides sp. PFB2-10]MDH6313119.1 hypothetical protein [Parabacteroides sp. PFB2-10]
MESRKEFNRMRGLVGEDDVRLISSLPEEEAKKLHEDSMEKSIAALANGIRSLGEENSDEKAEK